MMFLKNCKTRDVQSSMTGDIMSDLTHVTYCGLYCKLCDNLARIPEQSSALYETLRKGGWEYFGPQCIAGFNEFWSALEALGRMGQECKGCRGGCGNPDCNIRKCAQDRNVTLCSSCEDYPCDHISELAKRYPNVISDGKRQQELGLDKWIQLQEQRCKTGFCYCDIRYEIS